ncbi:hypothetical protein NQ318_008109 [Aromia moschata]|uniref:Uncharacterized protein n=1 Tax=Aromia moschata TaxID=1265417 RepID=A0AAV8YPB9_9CUCU|nr:hypothetical protein NQ318_008109 [Aromia moschata]
MRFKSDIFNKTKRHPTQPLTKAVPEGMGGNIKINEIAQQRSNHAKPSVNSERWLTGPGKEVKGWDSNAWVGPTKGWDAQGLLRRS